MKYLTIAASLCAAVCLMCCMSACSLSGSASADGAPSGGFNAEVCALGNCASIGAGAGVASE